MPAFDRDSGSQDVDNVIRFLLDAGWTITFVSREAPGVAEERHANRLRQLGVATYAGFDWAERLIRSASFDLAVIAFWELGAALIPQLREHSPKTKVLLNSMDVHFLREARRSLGQELELGEGYGRDVARELNAYHAADAVIAVSDEERDLLADFLGVHRVHTLPIADGIPRSTVPLADRQGLFFVGNFRHLPNREAVEHLCAEVLPLVDPALLERHPLTVVGNYLDQVELDIDPSTPGLRLVGWVPSVEPYLHRARLSVVPLLHGAGVKRKVIQSMMAYTPVVTTAVGAEGLGLVQGTHALIAADASDFAAAVTRALTDDELWEWMAAEGAELVDARHGLEPVERTFLGIVERVLREPARGAGGLGRSSAEAHAQAVRDRVQAIVEPGATVLVASGGNEALVDLGASVGWHFPQDRDGGWAGYDPVDGLAAIRHLESQRERGARYLVLPKQAFRWRFRFPELHDHLETAYRRLHHDDHLIVYDLGGLGAEAALDPLPAATVLVLGTYDPGRAGPPPSLVAELGASQVLQVEQVWRPGPASNPVTGAGEELAASDADFTVLVGGDAIVPARFLDELIATQITLGADRLQPTHASGPAAGPPVTERHRGVVARELDDVQPLPILSVRRGAEPGGPTVLADQVTMSLRHPVGPATAGPAPSLLRLWTTGEDGRPAEVVRPEPAQVPRISVLIATYNRPDLLSECLESFADQTLPTTDYEVVVVDDGSDDRAALPSVLEKVADRVQVFGVRIDHAGRSAAKNVAVMLARAPIVLFFDDDDRAAPDYLERHLAAHAAHADDQVAILGHTDWAPELEQSLLMHYVTDVDRLMFAYERLADGQELDWRGFWEGRISCKRGFLLAHALHDQRLAYSIDVEMGWRLAPYGLRIVYDSSARSLMARPIDLDAFCARTQAKGRAHAVTAALHPGTAIAGYLALEQAVEHWNENRFAEERLRRRLEELERQAADDDRLLDDLHAAYRELFRLLHAKGVAETADGPAPAQGRPFTVQPTTGADPDLAYDGTPADAAGEPLLSITIPVWSRTPELATMARRTVERIWEVARVPTEVIVIDNGSPHTEPLAARVYRYPENKGVATAWNTGIRLSRGRVLAVLNSDCRVEPGWDEALVEAALDGRRVAFPYTDHCDGLGFITPDQGGTAGWCFVLTRELYDEVGVFDEWFSPAYGEDTDYWHRAWQLGIELSPVPAARVVHARRTTARVDPRVDWLLLGHRYKYGWKHGVDPLRAPPYYNREIVEYRGTVTADAGR
jgi:glycosyltransferase involved in cell wall biosynthesis